MNEKRSSIISKYFNIDNISENFYNRYIKGENYEQNFGGKIVKWNISRSIKRQFIGGLVSVCFYKVKKYIETGKSFDVYNNGLKSLIKDFYNNIFFSGWKFRIYYDVSVLDDLCQNIKDLIEDGTINLRNLERLELYQYDIEDYKKNGNNNFHRVESIGMIFRFLPFIKNSENIQNIQNNLHYVPRVLVSDIDFNGFGYLKIQLLNFYIRNNIQFGYRTKEGHQFFTHYNCDIPYKTPNFWFIINNFVYQFGIFYPLENFNDFFRRSFEPEMQNRIKKCGMNGIFEYGYDEFFTNDFILKYYLEQNYLMCIEYTYGFYGILLGILEYCRKNNKIEEITPYIFELFDAVKITNENIPTNLKLIAPSKRINLRINKSHLNETCKPMKELNNFIENEIANGKMNEEVVREESIKEFINESKHFSFNMISFHNVIRKIDACIVNQFQRILFERIRLVWNKDGQKDLFNKIFEVFNKISRLPFIPQYIKKSLLMNRLLYDNEINPVNYQYPAGNEKQWRTRDKFILLARGVNNIQLKQIYISRPLKRYRVNPDFNQRLLNSEFIMTNPNSN